MPESRSYTECVSCGAKPRSTRHKFCFDCTPGYVWDQIRIRAQKRKERRTALEQQGARGAVKTKRQVPMSAAEIERIIADGDRRAGWPTA